MEKLDLHDEMITSLVKVEALTYVTVINFCNELPKEIGEYYFLTIYDLAKKAVNSGEKLYASKNAF